MTTRPRQAARWTALLMGLVCAASALADPLSPTPVGTPEATVTEFHAGLVASMKQGKSWDCKTRNAKLQPLVEKTFDFPYLAQKILRKRWKDLSADQQKQFTQTFRQLVSATYASNFNSFGGEAFENLGNGDAPGGLRTVKTRIVPKNRDPVPLDYVLHQSGGNWTVVNVLAAGVSDFSLRSAQYESVFAQKGFEGLIQNLQEQIAKLQQNC